jgi:hypothetical protein
MTKLGPHNRLIVGKLPCSHLAEGTLTQLDWRSWVLGTYRRISVSQMGPGDLYQCGGVLAVASEGARSTVART